MKVEQTTLEKKYHDAVEHWRRHWMPDYELAARGLGSSTSRRTRRSACARRWSSARRTSVKIGDHEGEKKRLQARRADRRKRPSTCSRSSARRHRPSSARSSSTPARCTAPQDDEDRFWVMRVMAEELRHGYQMFHLLLSQDWTHVSGGVKGEAMVEEILSMQTGSHVLDAFNLEYDSFIDNICFAAIIDRVGKYQLTMQKVCAYKPMADSMPPMLREEAFHLAAGVIPLRRWAQRAAQGDPLVTMSTIQKSMNKWYPRALEMFGDERGGDTNIKFGFKDMKNREAQDLYVDEVTRMVRDINARYLRGALPAYTPEKVEQVLDELEREPRPARRRRVRRSAAHCRTVASSAARASPRGPWSAWTARRSPTRTPTSAISRSTCPRPTSTTRDMRMYAETLRQGRRRRDDGEGRDHARCRSSSASAEPARARARCGGWWRSRPRRTDTDGVAKHPRRLAVRGRRHGRHGRNGTRRTRDPRRGREVGGCDARAASPRRHRVSLRPRRDRPRALGRPCRRSPS